MVKLIFSIALSGVIGLVIAWRITPYAEIYDSLDIYNVNENEFGYFANIPVDKGYKKIMSEGNKDISKYKDKNSHTPTTASYHQIISSKSKKYNIEPSLVNAVIKVESNWDSKAVSRKGAMGLMQLMPSTAKEMHVRNAFNPEENIEGGIRYLRYLLDKFNGDLTLALAAYNAGPKKIEKFRGIPPITETRQYVKRVLSIYNGKNSGNKKSTPKYKAIQNDGTALY